MTGSATPPGRIVRGALALMKRMGADPSAPVGVEGRWPSTTQAFLWDLLPDDPAPARDGVVAPSYGPPEWVAEIPDNFVDEALALERTRHRDERESVATVEGKASRLLTPTVTLLAATIALTAFELKAAAAARTWLGALLPAIGAAAGTVAVGFLFVAVFRALDADTRVGVYGGSQPSDLAKGSRNVLEKEALGRELASWVRRKKATRLMGARAAVSRAVVAVSVALLFGGLTLVTREHSPGSSGQGSFGRPSLAPSASPRPLASLPPSPSTRQSASPIPIGPRPAASVPSGSSRPIPRSPSRTP